MSVRAWALALVAMLPSFGCGGGGGVEGSAHASASSSSMEIAALATVDACPLFDELLDEPARAALAADGYERGNCMPKGNGSAIQFVKAGDSHGVPCRDLVAWAVRTGACRSTPRDPSNWTCTDGTPPGIVLSAMCTPKAVQMTLMWSGTESASW